MFKKAITTVLVSSILLSGGVLQGASVFASEVEKYSEISLITEEKEQIDLNADDFGLSEDLLDDIRNDVLDSAHQNTLNESLQQGVGDLSQSRSITVGAVIGIIAGCMAIGGGLYKIGKYAGKQAQVRLKLTPKAYKANRWGYRAAIAASFGVLVALGFDDYFYGI